MQGNSSVGVPDKSTEYGQWQYSVLAFEKGKGSVYEGPRSRPSAEPEPQGQRRQEEPADVDWEGDEVESCQWRFARSAARRCRWGRGRRQSWRQADPAEKPLRRGLLQISHQPDKTNKLKLLGDNIYLTFSSEPPL